MRKHNLVFLTGVLIFSFALNAQIKKGSVFLGGDISGSMQKTKSGGSSENEQNGFTVSPVVGKAIRDNLVFGVNGGIGFSENESASSSDSKQISYGLGVFLRKYKPLGNSGFYLFLQGGLNFSYYHSELEFAINSFKNDTKRYGAGVNAYPGISYAVNKKLHLETGFNNLLYLNYWHEKHEEGISPRTEYITNGFNIGTSLNNISSLYLGFRVLLSK